MGNRSSTLRGPATDVGPASPTTAAVRPATAARPARALLVCVWLAAGAFGGVAAAGVIGEDERRAPEPEDAGLLHALGHIMCTKTIDGRGRRGAGTATLVGNRSTVLTAAHVFADEAGPRGPAVRFDPVTDCVFRQYDERGEIRFESAFLFAELGEYWRNLGVPNQDWAVLRIAEPLPDGRLALPFAAGSARPSDFRRLPIRIVAYHADLRSARRMPLLSEGELFSVEYGGYGRLAHTADMGRMSSGAAIVHRTADGQDVVVGINRSSARHGEYNLAVPLSDELLQVLRSLAWGQVPIHQQRLAQLGSRAAARLN